MGKVRSICIVSPSQPWPRSGGVGAVNHKLLNEFRKRGIHTISYYEVQYRIPQEGEYQFTDTDNLESEANVDTLVNLIKEHEIQILLSSSIGDRIQLDLCLKAARQTGVKVIDVLHNNPRASVSEYVDYCDLARINGAGLLSRIKNRIKYPWFRWKAEKILRHSYQLRPTKELDAVACLSGKDVEYVKNISNAPDCKFVAISNPIEIAENITPYEDKEKIVLFVARLTKQKRLDRVLRAWKTVSLQHEGWRLVIIGDGDFREWYEDYARNLHLKNYSFEGNTDPKEWYEKAMILCMASSHEGFGLVLLEAQNQGVVPIVYDAFPSLRNIIPEGKGGVLVKAYDEKQYAEELSRLMEEDDYRQRKALEGRETVKNFSPTHIIPQWINLMESLLPDE